MSRLEAWLLHLSTFIVSATGLIYAGMHYLMKPADPFSVVNHPLEPYMIAFHIVIAPLLILAVGMIVNAHILWKLSNQSQIARRSGIWLIPLFAIMVVSGYLLQVNTSWRNILVVLHLGSGSLWFLIYLGHQIASLRFRRMIAVQNSERESIRIQ